MSKKLTAILLAVLLLVAAAAAFSGCGTRGLKIVFLGDSIAEAILGPVPMTERESYGYYSVIGKRNYYEFKNRAVSGHQSADMLEFIGRDDEGADITRTLLRDADIIHISILGNDFLQNGLNDIFIEFAREQLTRVEGILADAAANFAQIISVLKGYNPGAVIMVQTVYNPAHPDTVLVNEAAREELTELGIEKETFREYAQRLLDMLNGVIKDYDAEHPGEIVVVDVWKYFNDIYTADTARGLGLIIGDGIHPSSEGHAVIADAIQDTLEELELANHNSAVRAYRKMRIEQLERMYPTVDAKSVKRELRKADSCAEITKIYFDAVRGILPIY